MRFKRKSDRHHRSSKVTAVRQRSLTWRDVSALRAAFRRCQAIQNSALASLPIVAFNEDCVMNACVYAIKFDSVVRYMGKGTNGRVHVHMAAVRVFARKTRKHVKSLHRKFHDAHRRGAEITHEFIEGDLTDRRANYQTSAEGHHRWWL
jgi:hypothetical protein